METVSKKKSWSRREILVVLAGAGVGIFAFALYFATLAPTVLYYNRPNLLDCVMYQVQVIVLGITGPTGEPGYTLLTHLFTYLPIGDLAYRVNFASAVYATGTIVLVFVIGMLLTRRIVAALVGALAMTLGATFWSQAVVAEVYTLNTLLILIPMVFLLYWQNHRRDRYLLFTCFFGGLALTNHLTSALVVPAGLLFVGLNDWRKLVDWRLVLKGLGLFFLALTPYAFLPIRAMMNPPINEADPSTLSRFWELLEGGDQQRLLFTFGITELPKRFEIYGHHLFGNFHMPLIILALAGITILLARNRSAAAMLLFPYLVWLIHALEFNVFDVYLFFIPTYLMICLAMSVGARGLLEVAEGLPGRLPDAVKRAAPAVVSILLIAVPLYGIQNTYQDQDMSHDYRGREIINDVVKYAAPNSTILHHRSTLWYMVLVEKKRQDLTIVDPWFPGRQRYRNIVWPGNMGLVTTNLRYGTNDYTGVSTAFQASHDGHVYILNQDSAAPWNFYDAGFKTEHVAGDLFELVPPKRDPYIKPDKDSTSTNRRGG